MIKFTDYINVTAFFIALAIGLFFTYIFAPKKRIIIKYPTPENADKLVYKDNAETCYKYKPNEIQCPTDKSMIKSHNIID